MILRYLFNDPNLLTKGISHGYFNKKPGYDLKSAPVNRPLCSIPHLKCNELIWTSLFVTSPHVDLFRGHGAGGEVRLDKESHDRANVSPYRNVSFCGGTKRPLC